VSNLATSPPLLQPVDDILTRSIFDFQPALTDDRRPPPSDEPPSAALRRYLNPHISAPPDSPTQLHFWVDKQETLKKPEMNPRLKIKKKYQPQRGGDLPPVVPLATCIPSTIRTAHASSPPIWLVEPDGRTPSNGKRAAGGGEALVEIPHHRRGGLARPREPRENRDFLRIFVCELNMRRGGKLSDDAVGHARLWLPPVDELQQQAARVADEATGGGRIDTRVVGKPGRDRWPSWTVDDL